MFSISGAEKSANFVEKSNQPVPPTFHAHFAWLDLWMHSKSHGALWCFWRLSLAHCHIYHVESPWLPGSAKENYKHLRMQKICIYIYHVSFVKLTAKHLKIGQPYPKRKACLPTIHFQVWIVSFRGWYLWKTMQNSKYSKKRFVRRWHRCMITYIYIYYICIPHIWCIEIAPCWNNRLGYLIPGCLVSMRPRCLL